MSDIKDKSLTKEEAIQAMREGKKVTHRHFSDNEWITMDGGKVLTEEGYKHNWNEFWHYRADKSWDDGYSIWKDKSEEKHSPLPTAIEFLKLHGFDTTHANVELAARMMEAYTDCLKQRVEQLQKFKDYVHDRLDKMGIPVDPESPHKEAGCRIGGRLDIVEAQKQRVEQLEGENENLKKQIEEFRVLHGAWRDALALNPKQ